MTGPPVCALNESWADCFQRRTRRLELAPKLERTQGGSGDWKSDKDKGVNSLVSVRAP